MLMAVSILIHFRLRYCKIMSFMTIVHLGFFPLEMGCDVGEGAVGLAFEHVLVAEGRLQGAEMGYVWAYLDIVELLFVYVVGDVLPATVPRHFVLGITPMDVCCQVCHLVWCGVAAHETDAGDALAMFRHQAVYGIGIERPAGISPQVGAVAARTPTGTPCDVDGQRGLVGHLLENNIGVQVFKHRGNSGVAPLLVGLVRSY